MSNENLELSVEMLADLKAKASPEVLGLAYELLVSGRCPSVEHAVNAARRSELGILKRYKTRAFSDIKEGGNVDVIKSGAIDLELPADYVDEMRNELAKMLDDDAWQLEAVLRGEAIGRSKRNDRRLRVELRHKCQELLSSIE